MKSVFQRCPRCGGTEINWPDDKHFKCAGCGLTFYRNITSAVAGFIVDAQGRMLFIRRSREPARGMLAVPGGFIDPGETAENALKREVFEEVGLEIGELRFLCSAPNIYRYRDVSYDVIDLFFFCPVESFQHARALDEVDGLVIEDPARVDPSTIAFPSIRMALSRYLDGLKRRC